jgi:prepilin-type N-terminal cleavage/methylation domain-containing protein
MLATSLDRQRGFTLTELAVVFVIISLLLGTAMYTLSAQTEQRNFEETRRRLEAARELILGFAVANGRLPCPATTTGFEAITTPPNCDNSYGGFLPAQTIGFQTVDSSGFGTDAWGNRIRYAVSTAIPINSDTPQICRPVDNPAYPPTLPMHLPPVAPHFTDRDNLRRQGLDCQPSDLIVCRSATGITATACGGTANQIMSQNLVVAIVFSTGKNGAIGPGGSDETANLNGDQVFVWHTPAPVGATNGEFDDQMTWITVGELYGKLIAAGLLP